MLFYGQCIVHVCTDALHRDQIRENVLVKQYYCDVDIAHLISYNEELAHRLNTEPSEILPLVSLLNYDMDHRL